MRFSLVYKPFYYVGSLSIRGFHFLLGIGLAGNLRRLKMSVILAWGIGHRIDNSGILISILVQGLIVKLLLH